MPEIDPIDGMKYFEFSADEVKALYRMLSHQYISYEDMEAIEVVRKIQQILEDENERIREDAQGR